MMTLGALMAHKLGCLCCFDDGGLVRSEGLVNLWKNGARQQSQLKQITSEIQVSHGDRLNLRLSSYSWEALLNSPCQCFLSMA